MYACRMPAACRGRRTNGPRPVLPSTAAPHGEGPRGGDQASMGSLSSFFLTRIGTL